MRSVLLSVLLAAFGCDAAKGTAAAGDAAAPDTSALTSEARIPLGETAVVDGVAVGFERVERDSRCPEGAACVWEGEAVVTLALDGKRQSVRVLDPERGADAGVAAGGRVVHAVALTAAEDVAEGTTPVVTVVVTE